MPKETKLKKYMKKNFISSAQLSILSNYSKSTIEAVKHGNRSGSKEFWERMLSIINRIRDPKMVEVTIEEIKGE